MTTIESFDTDPIHGQFSDVLHAANQLIEMGSQPSVLPGSPEGTALEQASAAANMLYEAAFSLASGRPLDHYVVRVQLLRALTLAMGLAIDLKEAPTTVPSKSHPAEAGGAAMTDDNVVAVKLEWAAS